MLSDRSKKPNPLTTAGVRKFTYPVGTYFSALTPFDAVLLYHLDLLSKVIQGADFSWAYLDAVEVWGLVTA